MKSILILLVAIGIMSQAYARDFDGETINQNFQTNDIDDQLDRDDDYFCEYELYVDGDYYEPVYGWGSSEKKACNKAAQKCNFRALRFPGRAACYPSFLW